MAKTKEIPSDKDLLKFARILQRHCDQVYDCSTGCIFYDPGCYDDEIPCKIHNPYDWSLKNVRN